MRGALGFALLGLCSLGFGCKSAEQIEPVADGYESCAAPSLGRAERALARGEPGIALQEYAEVVVDCPEFVPGHQRYQDLAMELGDEAEAEMRAYYADLPDDGKSPVPPYLKARLQGAFDERRQQLLQDSIARDPSFYFAYLELARMWNGLGRTQNELAQLERAIQAKPDSPDANLALGRVLSTLSRSEEAVIHYANYLARRPADREAAREYVSLLVYGLARPAEARHYVDELLADDPEDLQAVMDSAALAWLDGDRDEAAELYRRAIQLAPERSRAVLNLGNLYFLTPDRPEADKRRDWPLAREAYRTFLAQSYAEDMYDLLDVYVTLPYRIAVIDAMLGELPADAETLAPEQL